MKTFKIILWSLCFFSTTNLFAQSNEYIKGYMITSTGDTITGYIKDEVNTVLSKEFLFKTEISSKAKRFSPITANGFYFEPSFYFESIEVDKNGQTEKVFLRKLLDGYTSLYQEFAHSGSEFLMIKTSGERLHITKVDSTVGNQYFEDKKYIGQIKYFLSDCPKVAVSIKSISFNSSAIAKVINQYNNCKYPNQATTDLGKNRKLRLKLGAVTGGQSYKIEILTLQPPNRAYEDKNVGFQVGAMVNLSYFRKLSLRTGVMYNAYRSETDYTYSLGEGNVSHEISHLTFPFILKYNLSTKKLAPYLFAGYQLGTLLNAESKEIRIEVGREIINKINQLEYNQISGVLGGIGLSYTLKKNTSLNVDIGFSRTVLIIRPSEDVLIRALNLNISLFF